jgi:hypothetical protein
MLITPCPGLSFVSWRYCLPHLIYQSPIVALCTNLCVVQDDASVAGTIYVDDCFLGVSGGSNLLPNPGFESGNVTWGKSGLAWNILQNP